MRRCLERKFEFSRRDMRQNRQVPLLFDAYCINDAYQRARGFRAVRVPRRAIRARHRQRRVRSVPRGHDLGRGRDGRWGVPVRRGAVH